MHKVLRSATICAILIMLSYMVVCPCVQHQEYAEANSRYLQALHDRYVSPHASMQSELLNEIVCHVLCMHVMLIKLLYYFPTSMNDIKNRINSVGMYTTETATVSLLRRRITANNRNPDFFTDFSGRVFCDKN